MAGLLKKLILVMWKNLIIRKRHWLLTIFEIVIPILLFILAAAVRSNLSDSNLKEASYSKIIDEQNLLEGMFYLQSRLFFAPSTDFTNEIMTELASKFKAEEKIGFSSEDELLTYYESLNETRQNYHAVVFENLVQNGTPDHLKYKIRLNRMNMQTSRLFPDFQEGGPGFAGHYTDTGFLAVQYMLDKAYLKKVGIDTDSYKLTVQQFPYPEYYEDSFVEVFSFFLPFCTVLSFVMLCPSILKRVVEEKQSGVKELMKMMGLKSWMLWIGWMINAMLVCMVSVTIITFLLIIPSFGGTVAVLNNSDGLIVWLFLILYCIAGIVFCFAISSLFSRPTLAMSCGVILWILSFSATFPLVTSSGYIATGFKILTTLLPNTAVIWGYRLIISYESKYVGIHWENLFQPPSGINGDLSVGIIWIMLIVDIFLYSFLTWYIDSVMPGQYGIAKPWYFICMPSYWRSSKVDDLTFSSMEEDAWNKKFEKPPANRTVGIKVQNLHKVFKSLGGQSKKVAVDDVTLDIYKGEITALLGHNGAGKTTTMSILTGMFSPTSGSVHIDGYDIRTNIDKVRESLGLCPQHNLLFTDLTVMEHLMFFAMLKGCNKQEAESQACDLIERFNLMDKRNKMATTLSGGMKRKLSLGIALIGHTKVLMLDEPTSGMDPEARREIWDILLSMRGERTILITTHFMEEADVVGDRIAIMDHGRVQCYGTSLFLKKLYGTGYQLNLLKKEGCNVQRITETVQLHIPEGEVKSEMGSVLSYTLPSEQSTQFSDLFDALENKKEALKISSIGVSITTLEEVFLKVGKEAEDEHDGPANSETSVEYVKLNGSSEALTYKRSIGCGLLIQQLLALCKKKIVFTRRNWFTFLYQAAIPIAMAILTLVISANTGSSTEPARLMNLSDYGKTEVLYSSEPQFKEWSSSYMVLIKAADSNVSKVDIVSSALLHAGENNIQDYRNKYIVAAEFNSSASSGPVMNAMFSSNALHSPPISLNLMSNTILKMKFPKKSVTVINHPLEEKENSVDPDLFRNMSVMMLWVLLMPFGLLFLTASFLTFPLLERVSKAKQLQLMTGVPSGIYWFACFLWDLFLYLIVEFIMIIIVLGFDPLHVFNGGEEIGVFTLLLLMYGLSAIPFAYLFSHVKNTNAGAFALVVIVNLLIGLIMSLVVFVLMFIERYKNIAKILQYIFELIPHFTITYSFAKYSFQVLSNNRCRMKKLACDTFHGKQDICCLPECQDGYCPALYKPYLEFANKDNPNGIGGEVTYLVIDALLYWVLIFLVEFGVIGMLFEVSKKNINNYISKMISGTEEENQPLDDDVLKEQDRVDGHVNVPVHQPCEDIMLVHNLSKKYTRTFAAVKGISFGVAPGECFGLLGVNGAGKTTTFKMLTGDEIPTSGEAWINKFSLRKDKFKFLAQIGYCPQFDAINEALTGREMLSLFAKLRGVSDANIDAEVNKWLTLMGLREYESRKCGTYSGGNKRKLSTAMALIGDPPIVFLDEPTSGVDPVARRNLWTVLTSIQKSGQSVVLTSHSMEECEALCNRLAIMVKGQFMCMGGIQYLKQKFGQGFTILIKLRVNGSDKEIVNRLKQEIDIMFPACNLKDEHQGLLHYHVTDPSTPWHHLFNTMERLKEEFSIVEDYTISETTLEQVFLSFARKSTEEIIEPAVNT